MSDRKKDFIVLFYRNYWAEAKSTLVINANSLQGLQMCVQMCFESHAAAVRTSCVSRGFMTSKNLIEEKLFGSNLPQFHSSWDPCRVFTLFSFALCQQSGSIWMLSVRTLFGIGFLVTSRVGAVLAQTGTCPLSTAANLRKKDCLGSRAASTMAKTIKYLG